MNKRVLFLSLFLMFSVWLPAQTKLPAIAITSTNQFTGDLVRFGGGVSVVKENYKYGIRKANGDWIVYPTYEFMSDDLSGGLILFKEKDKYGYMDFTGKIVIEPAYKSSSAFKNGYAMIYDDNSETKLIDKTGKIVFSYPGRISDVGDNGWVAVAPRNGGFKYVDFQGRTMLESAYLFALGFNNGVAVVQVAKNDYCLVDEKGNIKGNHYYAMYRTTGNLYEVQLKPQKGNWFGLTGLIDNEGRELVPLIYKTVYAGDTPVGVADTTGKAFYLDIKTGKKLFDTDFDQISSFTDGAALVKKDLKVFFIDKNGKAITQSLNGDFDFFYSGEFIRLKRSPYWSVLDMKGKEKSLVPTKIDDLDDFDTKYGLVRFAIEENNIRKYGLLNKHGKIIAEAKYAELRILQNGTAAIRKEKNGLMQCIDSNGKLMFNGTQFTFITGGSKYYQALPENAKEISELYFMDATGKKLDLDWSKYSYIGPCYNDIMPVKSADNRYGIVDIKGKEIIPTQYEALQFFVDGYASAKKDGKWGVIDLKGTAIVPHEYEEIIVMSNGFFVIHNGKKWALFNKAKRLTDFSYDETAGLSDGLLPVRKGEGWGYINVLGQEVIPCTYQAVYPFRHNLASVAKDYSWRIINSKQQQVIPQKYMNAAILSPVSLLVQQPGEHLVVKNPLSK